MKTIFLLVVFSFYIIKLDAQINLEHTFESSNYWTTGFTVTDGLKFCLYSLADNKIKIYNTDYSLYRSFSLALSANETFTYLSYPSDKLFNSDAKIEILIFKYNSTSLQYALNLYSEDGTIIKQFGNKSNVQVISNGNSYKLKVSNGAYNSANIYEYTDDIYSLPGILPTSTSSLKSMKEDNPYPNPSFSIVNLPYTLKTGTTSLMKIYNMNGQIIEQKTLDYSFDKIALNVESYLPGIYIFEYNGISDKFIVK